MELNKTQLEALQKAMAIANENAEYDNDLELLSQLPSISKAVDFDLQVATGLEEHKAYLQKQFDEATDIKDKLNALGEFYFENADTYKQLDQALANSIDEDGEYTNMLSDKVFYWNGAEDFEDFCHYNGWTEEYVDKWADGHPDEVKECQAYLDNEIAERNSADESENM